MTDRSTLARSATATTTIASTSRSAGSLALGDPTLDMAAIRPVIRPDLGQIWYDSLSEGFHVLEFADGVFPEFERCPPRPDWFVTQYNPDLQCPAVASQRGTAPRSSCRTQLRVSVRELVPGRRAQDLRSATVYVNGERVRSLRGARSLRRAIVLRGLKGATVVVRIAGRTTKGRRISRAATYDLCAPNRVA